LKKASLLASSVALATAACLNTGAVYADDYSDHRAVLFYAEYITDPDGGEPGGIEVLQQDIGNGQLSADFVFGDPRRALFNGGSPGVNYSVNDANMSADGNLGNQQFWMRESVAIWTQSTCSNTGIVEVTHNDTVGVVEYFFETGQILTSWGSDLTQVGFRSAAEFPYFAANPRVLGVAFTLVWVDGDGNATDIDNNGKTDVAFREIYYNDEFAWADNGLEGRQPDGTRLFDFPTVAIHEVGHGLSAAHFGLIGIKDGALFVSPRTIMNAIYGGTLRELTGRDEASHCSNWAQWPLN
jgi:hypothetical protein